MRLRPRPSTITVRPSVHYMQRVQMNMMYVNVNLYSGSWWGLLTV